MNRRPFPSNHRPIDEVDFILEQARELGYNTMLQDAQAIFGMTRAEMIEFLGINAPEQQPTTPSCAPPKKQHVS